MIRSTSTAALSTALMLGGYCLMPKSSYSQVIPPPPILEGKNPITTKDQSKEPSIPGGLNQNSPAVGAKPSKNIGKDLKNSREQLFNKNHVFQVSNYKIICSESKLSQKRSLLNDRCIPLDPDQDIQTTTLGSLINKALKVSRYMVNKCKDIIDELSDKLILDRSLKREQVEMKIFRKYKWLYDIDFENVLL